MSTWTYTEFIAEGLPHKWVCNNLGIWEVPSLNFFVAWSPIRSKPQNANIWYIALPIYAISSMWFCTWVNNDVIINHLINGIHAHNWERTVGKTICIGKHTLSHTKHQQRRVILKQKQEFQLFLMQTLNVQFWQPWNILCTPPATVGAVATELDGLFSNCCSREEQITAETDFCCITEVCS